MQGAGVFVYLAFLVVIFYMLIMRPQQKKIKEHQEFVDKLNAGDDVITAGGIYGKIVEVRDKTVILNVASQVNIEFSKQAIVSRSS